MDLGHNGSGQGLGYNINIPWPHNRVGAAEYQAAFQSVVLPALRGFNPDLILVASGFDAVAGDILAGTRLPPRSYYHMTRQLLSLRKPVAVILEGGYAPALIAQASLNVMHALLGRDPPCNDSDSESEAEKSEAAEAAGLLDAVRRQLNTVPPWSGMSCPGSDRYFHEEPVAAAGIDVARKLSQLIETQTKLYD